TGTKKEEEKMLQVFSMPCGFLQFDNKLFFPNLEKGELFTVPVPSYLITHPKGNVVFDTGVHCQAIHDPVGRLGEIAKLFVSHTKPGEEIVTQLANFKLTPDDISYAINSHFHFDHCGGNEFFPRSTILVQKNEMAAARDPELRKKVGFDPKDFDHKLSYKEVDGDPARARAAGVRKSAEKFVGCACAPVSLPRLFGARSAPYWPRTEWGARTQSQCSVLVDCHVCHTAGQYPTVASLPLRTMGVRNSKGSSRSRLVVLLASSQACASPLAMKRGLVRSINWSSGTRAATERSSPLDRPFSVRSTNWKRIPRSLKKRCALRVSAHLLTPKI